MILISLEIIIWEVGESRCLIFSSNPYFYCFFDSSGQIALLSAQSLDGSNPELLLQIVRKCYYYTTHFIHSIYYAAALRYV